MRYLLITTVFLLCHLIYQTYNMYVGKYAPTLSFFGISFRSHWMFTLMAVLIATPLLTLANYGFGMGFYFGKQHFQKIWIVLILFLTCQLGSMVISSYLFFKEWPSQGVLLGLLLTIVGLVIATVWH